jgi:hypothetical protein
MKTEKKLDILWVIMGLFMLFTGFWAGAKFMTIVFRREAIEHGAAHHDPKTGEFTWNEERKTP